MTMASTARSTSSTSTMPVGGPGGNALPTRLAVRLLRRRIEGAGEKRPLPGIRVRRSDGLAQVGSIGELAVDVGPTEVLPRLVELGAGPEEVAAPKVLLDLEPQAPPLPPAPPRGSQHRSLLVGEVALA